MPSAIRVHCDSDVDLPTANHTLHFGRFCAPVSIANYGIVQLGRITLKGKNGCAEKFPSVVKRFKSCDLVAGKVKPPPQHNFSHFSSSCDVRNRAVTPKMVHRNASQYDTRAIVGQKLHL